MDKPLDRSDTLNPLRGPKAALEASVGEGFAFRLMLSGLCCLLMFILLIIFIPTSNAYPLKRQQQDWALVAMNHLNDLQEAQCWVALIWAESRFDPKAKNGSHYGLAQMRNVKVKNLTPRAQVRWHLRYLDHRYNGSACKALNHLHKEGWH